MSSPGPLVCCAMNLGYGPSAKLVVIAEKLRQRGVRLAFVGSGVAHELVSRSRNLFETLLRCDGTDPGAIELVRSSMGMLSLMDRDFAPLAIQANKPLFVVDSLLWMRPAIPTEFRTATIYWSQRFVGASVHGAADACEPKIVGPITRDHTGHQATTRDGIVVHLGGCDASSDRELDQAYADFVVRGLVRFQRTTSCSASIAVVSGQRCTELLRERFPDAEIEFATLSHNEVLRRFESASVVLTSPGLTATLECFGLGAPTHFLPPQSYSQWCILRHLRQARLAPFAVHWEDLREVRLGDRLPPAVRNPVVRRAILEGVSSPAAAGRFHDSLMATSGRDLKPQELAARQREFFESLGPNGASTIAEDLAVACGSRQARV